MDKLQDLRLPPAEPGTPTLLDSIIRAELKRRKLTQPVFGPSATADTAAPEQPARMKVQ